MTASAQITKNAKSNLAFTLVDLPVECRKAMAQFYAFCRTVDDIVDEPGPTEEERLALLARWDAVLDKQVEELNELELEVTHLVDTYSLDTQYMHLIIEGCREDVYPKQPQTRKDLLVYCYKVASCVGIVSAKIMGASPQAHEYAVTMGYALQMVNIIRDMADDYIKHRRIYMPADDMETFFLKEQDIADGIHTRQLQSLLSSQAALADAFFAQADTLYNALEPADKTSLIPAQAMGLIYGKILQKMKEDQFHVFDTRYRVNTMHKIWLIFRARLAV